ncbi:MAG: tetratricopeptide repeat protein [Sphingobacteriaceae bacterium]|nr:tetratricopeptide repeat protein [Sphingobacteriaceae bacterium]
MYNKLTYFGLVFTIVICLSSCKSRQASVQKEPKSKTTKLSEEKELKFSFIYINACNARMKGNVNDALKLFNECLALDPTSVPVKYELAIVNKILGVNDVALGFAKECAAADPKNEWYQLTLVECYRTLKLYNNSVKIQENLVKNFPENTEFKENLAIEYTYIGQYEKAYHLYNDLEKQFGINEQLSINKIKLLQQENKMDEIEKEINKLIQSDKNNSRYLTYLADHYEFIKQPERAREIYSKILEIDPGNPTVHLALSDYYKLKGDEKTAFEELKLAFLNPELDILTKYNIGEIYYTTAKKYFSNTFKRQGFELVQIMLKVHPSSPESNALYADYLVMDSLYSDAIKHYRISALKDKSDYRTWEKLLDCNSLLSRSDSLEKFSYEAMELFPSQPMVYYYNGLANLQLRNYKKAAESLKDGLEYIVDDKIMMSSFYSYMGDAYFYLKEHDKSDKALDDALKINADNYYVLNNYAFYLSLRKEQLEKAEKLSKKSIELKPTEGNYMDTYGWILFQEQKYTQAEEWLKKAADLKPKNSNILEHYGDCLFKLNKIADAVKYWELSMEAGGNKERLTQKIKTKKLID